MRPYIEEHKCDRCGNCVDICPYDVFTQSCGEVIVLSPEDCIECTSCVEQCTKNAIYMDD